MEVAALLRAVSHLLLSYCFVAVGGAGDDDTDGLLDSCEYLLASTFAPVLMIQHNDGDPSRETYWSVEPTSSTEYAVRIFYAVGYHQDTGGQYGHPGDSEFIISDVRLLHGKWKMVQPSSPPTGERP